MSSRVFEVHEALDVRSADTDILDSRLANK